MRRLFIQWLVAATTALVPWLAWAGNQETAEQIATSLRSSGQLSDYKIAVKYQDGTVWLQGRVNDQDQLSRALKLVFQDPRVSRVVNNLSIGASGTPATASQSATAAPGKKAEGGFTGTMNKVGSSVAALNPLRGLDDGQNGQSAAGRAQRISAADPAAGRRVAYSNAKGNPQWLPVAAMQPAGPAPVVPAAPIPAAAPEAIPPGAIPVMQGGAPLPMYASNGGGGPAPVRYDQPAMPNYAWPSYAAYPNYAALTYPKQYSPTAWPYIGPFYPYPQVPLGWRKVKLEWDDGWWFLDFSDKPCCAWWR
jgi:hypothetical protein